MMSNKEEVYDPCCDCVIEVAKQQGKYFCQLCRKVKGKV
jgi:hypothetical protein